MIDATEPACWLWTPTPADIDAAQRCPESFGYVLLWNWQQARCAICGVEASPVENGRLRRDHDHGTGLVRGLLCTRCNALEGLAARLGTPGCTTRDPHDSTKVRTYERWQARNASLMALMDRYRADNPAGRLGLMARHKETIAPRGIVLPREYAGPLPIFDVDAPTWRAFYRTTGSGGGVDNRMGVLAEFLAWTTHKEGAKLPRRPDVVHE